MKLYVCSCIFECVYSVCVYVSSSVWVHIFHCLYDKKITPKTKQPAIASSPTPSQNNYFGRDIRKK